MNQHLNKAATKLLNALSNHSELIIDAYMSGSVDEAQHSPKVISSLIDLKVLKRPDTDASLRLHPSLRTLLSESLQDEHNRQIDANIGGLLASVKNQAEHYKEAMASQNYPASKSHMDDLTEGVYRLTETLTTNVRLLWSRINNDFGYVSTVDAKIRENELAQTQVSELLEQLEMFRFDELSGIAGANRELRHLLVVTLQHSFAQCTRELSLVQSKLIELLGRFREFKGRTRLLKGFLLHMEQKPDFAPTNYTKLTEVPDLFRQAKPAIKKANVDVNNVAHEQELADIVASIKWLQRNQHGHANKQEAQQIILEQSDESISIENSLLKKAAEDYFCALIDDDAETSSLEYLRQKELDFDPEVWLYQVIGEYNGMPEEDRQYFKLTPQGKYHHIFSGNFIVDDVEVTVQLPR